MRWLFSALLACKNNLISTCEVGNLDPFLYCRKGAINCSGSTENMTCQCDKDYKQSNHGMTCQAPKYILSCKSVWFYKIVIWDEFLKNFVLKKFSQMYRGLVTFLKGTSSQLYSKQLQKIPQNRFFIEFMKVFYDINWS